MIKKVVFPDRTDILTDQKWDKVILNANVKEKGTRNRTGKLASWTSQNAMLNEKLATFLLLEGTSMQHVERSNVYEAAGGVDVIFQGKGAVWNDATQQTEAMDL
jgi:hypothetical protein